MLGATIREVSVPQHATAGQLLFVSLIEGQCATLNGFGNGYHRKGSYSEELAIALGTGLKSFGNDLVPQVKVVSILGQFLRTRYFSTLYAKAQNLRPPLRAAYDAVLDEVDFILTPTQAALPDTYVSDYSLADRVLNGWRHAGNTGAFNLTGHPALSMPAAEIDGLPVGIQIVGRSFGEAAILALAKTYEKAYGWMPHPS